MAPSSATIQDTLKHKHRIQRPFLNTQLFTSLVLTAYTCMFCTYQSDPVWLPIKKGLGTLPRSTAHAAQERGLPLLVMCGLTSSPIHPSPLVTGSGLTSMMGFDASTFFSTWVSAEAPPTVAKYLMVYFALTVFPAPLSPLTMTDWLRFSLCVCMCVCVCVCVHMCTCVDHPTMAQWQRLRPSNACTVHLWEEG